MNMKNRRAPLHTTKGSALIWALVLTLILALVIGAGVTMGAATNQVEATRQVKQQAYYSARSVIEALSAKFIGASTQQVGDEEPVVLEGPGEEGAAFILEQLENGVYETTVDLSSRDMGVCTVQIAFAKDLPQAERPAGAQDKDIIVTVRGLFLEQTASVQAIIKYNSQVEAGGVEQEDWEWIDTVQFAEVDDSSGSSGDGWINVGGVYTYTLPTSRGGNAYQFRISAVALSSTKHFIFNHTSNEEMFVSFYDGGGIYSLANKHVCLCGSGNSARAYYSTATNFPSNRSITVGCSNNTTNKVFQNIVLNARRGSSLTLASGYTINNSTVHTKINATMSSTLNNCKVFINGGATSMNGSLKGGTLVVGDGGTLNLSGTMTGTVIVEAGGTLNLNGGATVNGTIYVENGAGKSGSIHYRNGTVTLNGDIVLQGDTFEEGEEGATPARISGGNFNINGEIHAQPGVVINVNTYNSGGRTIAHANCTHYGGGIQAGPDIITETWGSPIYTGGD